MGIISAIQGQHTVYVSMRMHPGKQNDCRNLFTTDTWGQSVLSIIYLLDIIKANFIFFKKHRKAAVHTR